MKIKQIMVVLLLLIATTAARAQYQFPACAEPWDPNKANYTTGEEVSLDGTNYRCKWWTSAAPGNGGPWESLGPCGDGGLGPDYDGPQRIIGYLPYWVEGFNINTEFDPATVTHLNVAFLLFQQNNNDYNSNDFASISFDPFHYNKVDSVLFDLTVLERSQNKNVTVSVALGGATDFAFIWLMHKYYNNDQKLEEIATLVTNYVNEKGLDGVDLDMECWWADPAIAGTSDQGGRVRGDKWGGPDAGAHPAGIGLTKLAAKLRAKMPNKLITAAVFGTSWYGNNYDDALVDHLDWLGLMTYDFTGSWDDSPEGPHSSLHKVPLGTYPKQSADNPIYSAQDALEYWMGMAEPAWNHDGGFNVPKAKLAVGVPMYGYDLANTKPAGNGFVYTPYKDIIKDFPNAATSYDARDPKGLNGYVEGDGKRIYFDTPKSAGEKVKYSDAFGHQGVIVWELTQDVPFTSNASIMKALNDAAGTGGNLSPVVNWTSPQHNQVIEQTTLTEIAIALTVSDPDGSISSVRLNINGSPVTLSNSGASYTAQYQPTVFGNYTATVSATDNQGAITNSEITFTVKEKTMDNLPPVVNFVTPENNADYAMNPFSAIALAATATDDGTVSGVVFRIGTTEIATSLDGNGQYVASYTPSSYGAYAVEAVATDNLGATGSASVAFTVSDSSTPNTPPVISSLNPANNALIEQTSLAPITLQATVTDDKAVSTVVFKIGSSNINGVKTGSNYAVSYTPVAFGAITYQIEAMDDEGAIALESATFTLQEKSTGTCTDPAWNAATTYAAGGTVVSHNGVVYRNKWWTQGEEPGTADVWEYVKECGGGNNLPCGLENWRSSAAYNGGARVIHNGSEYSAKWWTQGEEPGVASVWSFVAVCNEATQSAAQKSEIEAISTFPSPVTDAFSIEVKLRRAQKATIVLYDFSGKVSGVLYQGVMPTGKNQIQTDLSSLKQGFYLYRVVLEKEVYTGKFYKH